MNKDKVFIGIIVLLVVVFGSVLFFFLNKSVVKEVKEDYSVVYLATGEVYIGRLTTTPDLELKDIYILQVNKDATDPAKNTFQLQPLKDALFAPKSLHLIKDNVVFYGPLTPESKIAQTLTAQVK